MCKIIYFFIAHLCTYTFQDGNTSGVDGNDLDWDTEDELEIENFTLSSSSANVGSGEVNVLHQLFGNFLCDFC